VAFLSSARAALASQGAKSRDPVKGLGTIIIAGHGGRGPLGRSLGTRQVWLAQPGLRFSKAGATEPLHDLRRGKLRVESLRLMDSGGQQRFGATGASVPCGVSVLEPTTRRRAVTGEKSAQRPVD
jgi:hypothetical protein